MASSANFFANIMTIMRMTTPLTIVEMMTFISSPMGLAKLSSSPPRKPLIEENTSAIIRYCVRGLINFPGF